MIAKPINSVYLGQGDGITFVCRRPQAQPLVLSSIKGCAPIKVLVKGNTVYAQWWFGRPD
jgi:hypothetical protein